MFRNNFKNPWSVGLSLGMMPAFSPAISDRSGMSIKAKAGMLHGEAGGEGMPFIPSSILAGRSVVILHHEVTLAIESTQSEEK